MMLDLENRAGWPPELRVLLERYPREVWPNHANLGEMGRFWLDIHNGFRDLGDELGRATVELREGRVPHEQFRSWFAPRLRMFFHHLEGHHQIEDRHLFPQFRVAEPRLSRGFEVLEGDHHVIHAAMDRLGEVAAGFLRPASAETDQLKSSGDAYADASDHLIGLLRRHLDDEEDLVIPVILDRGEAQLGL